MAKLSNINGKFAVEDTGAIRFSDQTGTTGQILKSNGNSAPTWVDPNTVGTGPWLPLAGGILTGATSTASGISFTVGGILTGTSATFNGLMKLDAGGILQFGANTATPSMGVAIHRSAADTLNFVTASTNRLTINSSGNLLLKGTGVTSLLKFDSSAYGQILSTSNILYYDIDTQVFRNSPGTLERMRIDSNGNVGIGRTAPDYKLVVSNNNAEGIEFGPGYISGCNLWQNYNRTTSTYVKETHYGSEYHFMPAGGATGNVGIDTTSPSAKLEIKATGASSGLTFKTTDSSNNEIFYIKDGGVVGVRYYPFKIGVPSTTSNVPNTRFQIATTGGDFVVLNDGKTGIGTDSPKNRLEVKGLFAAPLTTGSAQNGIARFSQTSGNGSLDIGFGDPYSWIQSRSSASYATNYNLALQPNGGNVGIGTTSPNPFGWGNKHLTLTTTGINQYVALDIIGTGNAAGAILFGGGDGSGSGTNIGRAQISALDGSNLVFATNGSNSGASFNERMRITSAGHILFGNTTASITSDPGFKYIKNTNTPYFGYVVNTSSGNGYSNFHHYNTNSTFNGFRFYILNNGGIVNYSSNNVNLSDERVKNNIENSGNYLDKICSIPVRLFNYKDEPEGTDKNLGVIAQEVEAVAPELVNNDGFGETPEDGIELKTVYSTDMMYALMKAIQELKADNDILKSRIKILENK